VLTTFLRALKKGVLIDKRGTIGSVTSMAGWALHNHAPPLPGVRIVRGSKEKSTTLTTCAKKNYNSFNVLPMKETV
jgi:hypothetical protein